MGIETYIAICLSAFSPGVELPRTVWELKLTSLLLRDLHNLVELPRTVWELKLIE